MAFSRRKFLIGLGGAVVGLPFLEGLQPKTARADDGPPPYALFYRRGNGVQMGIFDRNGYPNTPAGLALRETDRWWPASSAAAGETASSWTPGVNPLSFGATSALSELEAYVSKTTVIRGLRHLYGTENGHPEGAAQGLTGAGVKYRASANHTEDSPNTDTAFPQGQSLDNLIAAQLTPSTPESLYMGVKTAGYTGISYILQGTSVFARAAEENLLAIYTNLFLPLSQDTAARELLLKRRKSVNDLVRSDISSLRNDPRLSSEDKARLDLHLSNIRDAELALATCAVPGGLLGEVQGYDANSIEAKIVVIGKLAALAVACGIRRSVVINVGDAQDITTYNEVPGAGAYQFHALSHRQSSEQNTNPFTAARDLHHAIDRFHLRRFKDILDILDGYKYGGQSLVDRGVNVHYSDLGSGQHIVTQLPYLYVGGAAGKLVTGKYVSVDKVNTPVVKFLNTIGAAVGVKSADGTPLHDFNKESTNFLTRNWVNLWYFGQSAPANGGPQWSGQIPALFTGA